MNDFKYTVTFQPRKNGWYMRASIPQELRQHFRNQRHVFKACGSKVKSESEALSILNGEKGEQWKKILLRKIKNLSK